MNKTQVFLILGGSILQLPLINEIKNRGWQAVVVDKNKDAIAASIADYFINISTRDTDSIYQYLIDKQINISHVVTAGTDMSLYVAQLSNLLNLSSISIQQATVTTYKNEMRTFLLGAGLLQPKQFSTHHKDEAEKWVLSFIEHKGFVIKPTNNMGARGVIFVEDIDDLSYSFELAQRESSIGQIIIEEYIEGDEISVDALVYEGTCYLTGVADRIIEKKDGKYFVEYGHNMPTQYNQNVILDIQNTMQKVADGLTVLENKPYHGALKGDIKITKNGDIIINEVASRLSGGFMSAKTFPLASDINLMSLYLDLITKNKNQFDSIIKNNHYKRYSIERAIVAEPGVIVEFNILEDAYKLADTIILNHKVGDIVYSLKSNIGKSGHIIIQADTLELAEEIWFKIKTFISLKTIIPEYNHKLFIKEARTKFNPKFCWVCKICDGINCASSIPGMGAIGTMSSFQNNIKSLNTIYLTPSYINKEAKPLSKPILQTKIMGTIMSAPLLTAPITGSISNMGNSISEWDYAFESGIAAKNLGLIPTFGDGATADKYLIGLKAIQKLGVGFPVFKPRDNLDTIYKRVEKAISMGVKAFGVDIDGLSFKTMQNKDQATSRKTSKDLNTLATSFSIPFFVKGVMTLTDAKLACESGVSAIIVSNHGGRVLDSMPGSASVLPNIAKYVKENYPMVDILVDGGIRSGVDIFKMLGLGAKAVLVGRPIVISAVHSERIGVQSLLESYIKELYRTMEIYGCSNLDDIPLYFKSI